MRGVYDDNIARVEEGRRDEYLFEASGALSVDARGPRLSGSAGYSVTAEFFSRDEEDREPLTHAASLAASYAATRHLSVRVADSVRYSGRRESDAQAALLPAEAPPEGPAPESPPAAAPGSVPTRRVKQLNNTLVAGATYAVGPFTALSLEYSLASERFYGSELTDSDTHRVTTTVGRQVSRVDSVGVVYGFSAFSFAGNGRRTRHAHDGRLRWGRRLADTADLAASLGGSFIDQEDDSTLEWAGVTGAVSLERREGLTRFRVGYSHDLSTGGGRGTVEETDRAYLAVARDFSRRWSARLGLAASRNRDVDTGAGKTDTAGGSVDLGIRLTEWLRGEAGYDVEYVHGPGTSAEYYVNRISVGLTAAFPVYRSTAF